MDAAPDDNPPVTALARDAGMAESGAFPVRNHPGTPFAWETYLRSLFLLAVIFTVGFLSWRPGVLRLSLLYSLSNPIHGDGLAWQIEADPLPPPMEIKRVVPPAEWRLGPTYSADWANERPKAREGAAAAGTLTGNRWRRAFENPWRWYDDSGTGAKRRTPEDLSSMPPQKAESPFRAGEIAAWPQAPAPTQAFSGLPSAAGTAAGATGSLGLPPLPPLPSNGADGSGGSLSPLQPLLPSLGGQAESASTPPPPAPLSGMSGTAAPAATPQTGAASLAPLPSLSPLPSTTPAPGGDAGEADWKNREITRAIPGAYLTVYPKLKFIGLCVPGQGYIRKYNQVGVPADSANPKMEARDGRTPYGRYYIADRHRDADGPRLYISWPSPEDARRIGLDSGRLSQVDNAWRFQTLPPQDTAAGGGVGFTGLRNWVETTEGGFALEAPQMEEIFTALPDKAWVFIQE